MITKLLRRDHFTSRKLFFVLYRMYIIVVSCLGVLQQP